MKMTAKLKTKEELKELDGFVEELPNRLLKFKGSINITDMMVKNKELITLTWNKEWKSFSDGNYEYSLDWLTDIIVEDEKLKLSLEVDGCKLTAKLNKNYIVDSSTEDVIYKSYKNRFSIILGDYSNSYITKDSLYLADYNEISYEFKSEKALTKWISRLVRCE